MPLRREDDVVYAAGIINSLSHAIQFSGDYLENIPGLLKRVIREDLWREYQGSGFSGKEIKRYTRFADFLVHGIEVQVDTLKNLIRDHIEARDLLDQMLQNPIGSNQYTNSHLIINKDDVYNIHNHKESRPSGTDKDRSLRRLRESRPDIHVRVLAGELSPHAGMIEAGFRDKTITIPLDPVKAARVIKRHFSGSELQQLKDSL
mgnify:CR=1 FL=1